ncbi:MAG TPA: saccharopine dehydrogenase C-terminal domain-containing protein [Bacteroidia bacterium]|nr:saccharopine dehydrogenase C-terminal domain-containing protein [Bacteroidia bacterium]
MKTPHHSIFIAGAGGIGRAAGLLLQKLVSPDDAGFEAEIWIGDISQRAVDEAVAFIAAGAAPKNLHGVLMPREGSDENLEKALRSSEVLLDCLPGSQAPRMARLARQFGLHYANLTEYVHETEEIRQIAEGAETGFILQTGLAPGFVGVLAMHLLHEFRAKFGGATEVEYISMKVGALTESANPPHFYGFTWSTIGVATEYVKDALVIRDFKTTNLPSLSEYEQLVIDGVRYEADLTSGGAADLPEALAGFVRRLDYKTIRWPGHYEWVQQQLKSVAEGADQANALEAKMLEQVPVCEDDLVVIQAFVVARDGKGQLRQHGKNYRIGPMEIGNQVLRAIQTTTAAPLVECARMLLTGKYKGVVLQSQLDAAAFLKGPFVKAVYGG